MISIKPISSYRALLPAVFAIVLFNMINGIALAEQTEQEIRWRDGSPIVQFDKRDDTPMSIVAGWDDTPQRRWPGPAIWTNRLQDWHVRAPALCCEAQAGLPCRTAHLIAHELSDKRGAFRLEVILTLAPGSPQSGWAGFLVGAALVHHQPGLGGGILAVVETQGNGRLVFRDMEQAGYPELEGQQTVTEEPIRLDCHRTMLNLEGLPGENGRYDLRFSAWAHHVGALLGAVELKDVPADRLLSNIALVANPGKEGAKHQFETVKAGGQRVAHFPDREFGSIAGIVYSLSENTLKLGAQFM